MKSLDGSGKEGKVKNFRHGVWGDVLMLCTLKKEGNWKLMFMYMKIEKFPHFLIV